MLPRWAESAVLDRVVEKASQTPGLLSKKEQNSNIYIFIEVKCSVGTRRYPKSLFIVGGYLHDESISEKSGKIFSSIFSM